MAYKQPISSELTLSTVNKEGEQPSGGSIKLFVYQHNISDVIIAQLGHHENILKPTPAGARAYYLPEYQEFTLTETLSWSGTSAETENPPLSVLSIDIVFAEDPVTGEDISTGSSVGGSSGDGFNIRYDSSSGKFISDKSFTGEVDIRYVVRRRLIKYHPSTRVIQGVLGFRDATLATFGKLHVRRSKRISDSSSKCSKQYVWWKGSIDILAADPNNGEWVEVAKVTSEYVAGANSKGKRDAYELPRGYPDNLQHDGADYKIPDPADEEDMKQERKHMRWKVNTVTGHVDFDSYLIQLAEPYRSNGNSFLPQTTFNRTEPSDEKAKDAYRSIDWANIKKQIQKEFPDCEGINEL